MTQSRYHDVYEGWKKDPEGFWASAASELDWFKTWDRVFDAGSGAYGRWFPGAECNTCHNAVDRHVRRSLHHLGLFHRISYGRGFGIFIGCP